MRKRERRGGYDRSLNFKGYQGEIVQSYWLHYLSNFSSVDTRESSFLVYGETDTGKAWKGLGIYQILHLLDRRGAPVGV